MCCASTEGEEALFTSPSRQGSTASIAAEDAETKGPKGPSKIAFGSSYKPRPKTPSGQSSLPCMLIALQSMGISAGAENGSLGVCTSMGAWCELLALCLLHLA